MILGIGIDIVKISRMEGWSGNTQLLKRYFHPDELRESRKRGPSELQSLAARFAAKEAYGKALGTGMKDLTLREIQVENEESGKPVIKLYGTARERFEEIGGNAIFLSLTHESDNAVAVVVLEA